MKKNHRNVKINWFQEIELVRRLIISTVFMMMFIRGFLCFSDELYFHILSA